MVSSMAASNNRKWAISSLLPWAKEGLITYLSKSLEVDQSDWNLTQTTTALLRDEVEEATHACVGMGQV